MNKHGPAWWLPSSVRREPPTGWMLNTELAMSILTKIKKRNSIKSAAITETASLAPESK